MSTINKIIPVYIALESDTQHLTLKKDSVRFEKSEKSNERKIIKEVDQRVGKLFKILLVGDTDVGKTAISIRFAEPA